MQPFPWPSDSIHTRPMHFDNSLHQGQADSRTLDRRIELFEQSEDPVMKTGIDSDAVVANGTNHLIAGGTTCDLDPRVFFLAKYG